MTKKIDEALATLSRVVPTRFQGEVQAIKTEIERLKVYDKLFSKPVDLVAEDENGVAAKLYGVSIKLPEGDNDDEN
jgi:hypothetical protein